MKILSRVKSKNMDYGNKSAPTYIASEIFR
jgi:hypothetical protein